MGGPVLAGKVAHDYDMGKPLGFSFTRLCRLEMLGNAWKCLEHRFHFMSFHNSECRKSHLVTNTEMSLRLKLKGKSLQLGESTSSAM